MSMHGATRLFVAALISFQCLALEPSSISAPARPAATSGGGGAAGGGAAVADRPAGVDAVAAGAATIAHHDTTTTTKIFFNDNRDFVEATDGPLSSDSASRLLSLEAEDVSGIAADADLQQPRAWWGTTNDQLAAFGRRGGARGSSASKHFVGSQNVASVAELKRMGHLMRRQLQPRWFLESFSFDYDPTLAPTGPTTEPTVLPTPLPTPLPSPIPSSLPTPLGPTVPPTFLPTPACVGDDEENYRFGLFDSGDDGWEGANFTITDTDGALVADGSLEDGSEKVVVLCLTDGQYTVTFGGGRDDNETSVAFLPIETQFTFDCVGPCTFDVILSGGNVTEGTAAPTEAPQPTLTPSPTTTGVPTTFDATQATLLTSTIQVSGVDGEDFEDDGVLVVQYALNDVISFLESPDDVVEVSFQIVERRRLQLDNGTAIITYSVLLDTAAEAGFSSNDDALETMENDVTEAAATGYLADRINYWASYFDSDFTPTVDPNQDPVSSWGFAPTTSPTVPPTIQPGPTQTPSALPPSLVTPVPTSEQPFVPTLSPAATPAPVIPTDSGSKKRNNNDAATLAIIIVCVIVGFLLLVCLGYMYMRNRERKLTERKDSWDISTMFTDEANLPDAEEMIDVEPETADAGAGAADVDEADVAGATLIEGGGAQGDLVPLDEDQPQALQKITQAAEL